MKTTKNAYVLPNPDQQGDWLIFADIYDANDNFIGSFGDKGTSLFAWWANQPQDWQFDYVLQFSMIMADNFKPQGNV